MKQLYMSAADSFVNNYEVVLKDLPVKKIVTSALILIGVLLIFSGLMNGRKNTISSSWTVINGYVVNSAIDETIIPSKNADNQKNTFFSSIITFEYVVNGNVISNSNRIGSVSKNNSSSAKKTVTKYHEGKRVKICYNPEDPKDSSIKTFSSSSKWFPIIFGLMFLSLGIFCVYSFYVVTDQFTNVTSSKKIVTPKTITRPVTNPDKPSPVENINRGVMELNGKWKLNYQVPSMRELTALSQTSSGDSITGDEILASGLDAILLSINGDRMIFNFNANDINGSCMLVSNYRLINDRLMLNHQSMDFLILDIEGFPPNYYTYNLNGPTLVLTTNQIKGIGDRQITYHFSKSYG